MRKGFFMNWSGRQAGGWFEFHVLMVAMSNALMVIGGGKWLADKVIALKLKGKKS
jgi:putative oxidoreductase